MKRLRPIWGIVSLCIFLEFSLSAQDTLFLNEMPIYTSLSEALKQPEKVFRLKLKLKKGSDSIPEEVFSLYNLRELRLTGSHLQTINQNIGQLHELRFLYLNKNSILYLPESVGFLKKLKILDLSRNPLDRLPNSIGNLTQLEVLDAWETQLFVLPETIRALVDNLEILDLRQVPVTPKEQLAMEQLLPKTQIYFSFYCECNSDR